ncbi:MAG: DNA polymerase III subunit gamma/tau [Firmicutes bacterium]|nr:DNA polymerase III subunit gamma/tau [Bacillota bacterium]
MRYTALYRRYRPTVFSRLIGQETTARILKAGVAGNNFVHAYLFAGPRGTGKTSAAKILARAVNCLSPQEGEPCGQCDACRRSLAGESLDVLEIDAASNRGIDEIRDLRERVKYLPAQEKYKVYIIDEVHMLTTEAFNALLKTLEEPPEQVLFILATTEPHKIPLTVLSRCQRFDFKPIPQAAIAGHLLDIANQEGIALQPDAAALIARKAEGGMRDAVSLLDQAAATAQGEIGPAQIAELTGSVDRDFILALARALLQRDVPEMLGLTKRLADSGRDFRAAFADLLAELRDLLAALLQKQPDPPAPEWALALPPARFIRLLVALADVDSRLRFSREQRITLELAFLKAMEAGEKTAPAAGRRPAGTTPRQETAAASLSPAAAGPKANPPAKPEEDAPPWPAEEPPVQKAPEEDAPPWPAEEPPVQKAPEEDVPPWPAEEPPVQKAPEEDVPPWPAEEPVQKATEEDVPPWPAEEPPVQKAPEAAPVQPAEPPVRQEGSAAENDLLRLQALWPDILQQVYKANLGTYFFVMEGKPQALKGDRLTLAFPPGYELHMTSACSRPAHKSLIEEAISQVWGKNLQIHGVILAEEKTAGEEAAPPPGDADDIEEDALF